MVDKHINFFEFQKAAVQPGCPLCRIVTDRAGRYIDNMLFEHVSNRSFRKAHRQAGGFCSFHSENLVSFRDGLAVAILGRDILEERIAHFRTKKPWKPKEICPVCAERKRIEHEYVTFLAACGGESDEERELQKLYRESEGLCAPHYGILLETCKKVPAWIRDFEEGKFNELKKRVDNFIELSAYGRQEEFRALSQKDQLVWKELALSLRGQADRLIES
ncbi:MAG: DUF6062 family protein [Treponema sp.]|jgi:hypothetical protein|nr:DUF6062 family protein [Treponema sp.]